MAGAHLDARAPRLSLVHGPTDPDAARRRLVARLQEEGVLRDPRVAQAMLRVPRHLFVPAHARREAYVDAPLGIGEGQTISAPHMVAIMLEALDLAPGHRVLEVGGGSGYHAACAAELVRPGGVVTSVEVRAPLAEEARRSLVAAGHPEVRVVVGDGSVGLAEAAPFDRISVAAAAPAAPPSLVRQLSPGGALLVPVGDRESQVLVRVRRTEEDALVTERLGGCRFVPLVGAEGFPP